MLKQANWTGTNRNQYKQKLNQYFVVVVGAAAVMDDV